LPTFALSAHTPAPVEEVWKLLHDPGRFPEWWDGVATIQSGTPASPNRAEPVTGYTMWLEGYPEYPMGQELRTGPGVVTVSCLVSDLQYTWRLSESPNPGTGTDISLHVEIPEIEGHRLETQRTAMSRSLKQLTVLASAS